jgi:two-component system chemotaxis sensor kinase CheA
MANDFNNDSLRERYLSADISKVTARAIPEAPGGKETYYLHIHFNEGARMENIRAFMLAGKLGEKGVVNRTIPANPETDPDTAGSIIERGFYISYTTSLFREQIETLIKGALSVETVSFLRRMPDGGIDAVTSGKTSNTGAVRVRQTGKESRQTTSVSEPPQKAPASAPQEAYAEPSKQHSEKPASDIGIEWKKLDIMLDLVGEIAMNESYIRQHTDIKKSDSAMLRNAVTQLGKLTNDLKNTVDSIRALPVSTMFSRIRRIVDAAGKNPGKDVDLVLEGASVRVDKWILDTLYDPIALLVQNAIEHALEHPKERLEAGKITDGRITLSARKSGDDLIISVDDDGRGLVAGRHEHRACIDAVKSKVKQISGTVSVENKIGRGVKVILQIPPNLAVSCVQAAVGKGVYAIPVGNIADVIKPGKNQIITDSAGMEGVLLNGETCPIARIHTLFEEPDAVTDISGGLLILANAGGKRVCLLVDRLIDRHRVVVRPLSDLPDQFCSDEKRAYISGGAVTNDGAVCPVLNIMSLV